ncbi:hypothetical protein AL037_21105, partial [Salipiger aestuarii]
MLRCLVPACDGLLICDHRKDALPGRSSGGSDDDSTADIIIGDPITTTTDDPGDTLDTEIEGGDIPADGQYDDISVVVTVDVAPLCIEITTGPVYVGDVVNADEAKAGFAITGAL